jgi:Tfp pilus assembly protein PilO
MKKTTKEKRQQLVLVVLVGLTVMGGLWYGLIRAQQRNIEAISVRKAQLEKNLANVKATIGRVDEFEAELEELSTLLSECEEDMASGDIYAWTITKIREFKSDYKVEIPQFSQIDGPRGVNLIPGFPYKQASLTISGFGRFHDIGMFLSDFENHHPFTRLCNLTIEPGSSMPGSDRERLSFRVDIVTLIRPGGSPGTGTL